MNAFEKYEEVSAATASVAELLGLIYGVEVGGSVNGQVRQLIDEYRSRLPRPQEPRGPLALTERDALLITYGDMVSEEGRSPLQALGEFCDSHLREVVSGVHLLPHFPYTSDDGFSVQDYFAVNPELGSWSDVAQLGQSFELMFDAVFNHMSAQGEWFQKFLADDPVYRGYFVAVEGNPDLSQVVRPRALPLLTEFQSATGPTQIWTTFSADQVDLNFRNPQVLLASLRALLFYVEHGARFIRLDAIAYLWKTIGTTCIHLPQTHQIVQVWRAVLDEVAPSALLITETNVPHRDNVTYFGDGTNEAQLVYNFALPPLVLHSLLRGNASHLTRWAQSLTLPSDRVTFFNFLASHDGVGLNPARGILPEAEIDFLVERCEAQGGFINYKHNSDGSKCPYEMNIVYFDAVNDPAAGEPVEIQVRRFIVSQAIMLALRGLPGIYFHSMFGSRNDREAALATGINRRINRQKFERSHLDEELAKEGSLRSRVFGLFRELLLVRRSHAAFSPDAEQQVLAGDSRVFAVLRTSRDGGKRVLCLHNVSGECVVVTFTSAELLVEGTWTNLLNQLVHRVTTGSVLAITLQPYEVSWLDANHAEVAMMNRTSDQTDRHV